VNSEETRKENEASSLPEKVGTPEGDGWLDR